MSDEERNQLLSSLAVKVQAMREMLIALTAHYAKSTDNREKTFDDLASASNQRHESMGPEKAFVGAAFAEFDKMLISARIAHFS